VKTLLLRWQSIAAALVGFVLSVAWEADVFSSVTEYPFTWLFGVVVAGLLAWGVVDALREQRRRGVGSPTPEPSTPEGSGSLADGSGATSRLDRLEREMQRLDDQVQELRREEL
jgi:hypothetical protein